MKQPLLNMAAQSLSNISQKYKAGKVTCLHGAFLLLTVMILFAHVALVIGLQNTVSKPIKFLVLNSLIAQLGLKQVQTRRKK